MDFQLDIRALEQSQAIEVAHLLNRYLSHRLNAASFASLFNADHRTGNGDESIRSFQIALDAIRRLEDRENAKVAEFSDAQISSYVDQISTLTERFAVSQADKAMCEQAERELRAFRAS